MMIGEGLCNILRPMCIPNNKNVKQVILICKFLFSAICISLGIQRYSSFNFFWGMIYFLIFFSTIRDNSFKHFQVKKLKLEFLLLVVVLNWMEFIVQMELQLICHSYLNVKPFHLWQLV
jgi:hypothetical protein